MSSQLNSGGLGGPFQPSHDQRGTGIGLTAAVIVVLFALAGFTAWFLGGLLAAQRARSGADLVALGAASAQNRGEDACQVATALASSNHVELLDCQVDVGFGEFVVRVKVAATLPGIRGTPDRQLLAQAAAGVVSQR